MRSALSLGCLIALVGTLSGCATMPLQGVDKDLQSQVRTRLGADVAWRRDASADRSARSRVDELASAGVSSDSAVQIALLSNPDLQIQLEQLGLARATWLAATQIANPVFGWSHRELRGGSGANIEYSIAQDLLSVFTWPGRRRSADAALQGARLDAAHAVLQLATAVRQHYLQLLAAERLAELSAQRAEVGQLMYELAERYHQAGNVSLMEREQHRDQAVLARADAEQARALAAQRRTALLRLLGVVGTHDTLKITDSLPPLPPNEPTLNSLEELALTQRLDLQALHSHAEAQLSRAQQSRRWRLLPAIEAQYSDERDPSGARVSGPGASVAVPLFNAQQAALAEQDVQARLAMRRAESMALDVRTQLRNAAAELVAARRIAMSWRDEAVPAREAITEGATREYFFMLKGPWDPLLAQQELVMARMHATESLRDYWLARISLAAAAGQPDLAALRLPANNPVTTTP